LKIIFKSVFIIFFACIYFLHRSPVNCAIKRNIYLSKQKQTQMLHKVNVVWC